ncbi:hypothetical protein BKA70DRAFT_1235788 [Coprinopsis sp. MPI-PUGE-AT-0042]|nr:hypothetical protein BKA70DRAFT_1235788 [Coprinopsis sp. MPI-PUGE-AT-0042]
MSSQATSWPGGYLDNMIPLVNTRCQLLSSELFPVKMQLVHSLKEKLELFRRLVASLHVEWTFLLQSDGDGSQLWEGVVGAQDFVEVEPSCVVLYKVAYKGILILALELDGESLTTVWLFDSSEFYGQPLQWVIHHELQFHIHQNDETFKASMEIERASDLSFERSNGLPGSMNISSTRPSTETTFCELTPVPKGDEARANVIDRLCQWRLIDDMEFVNAGRWLGEDERRWKEEARNSVAGRSLLRTRVNRACSVKEFDGKLFDACKGIEKAKKLAYWFFNSTGPVVQHSNGRIVKR